MYIGLILRQLAFTISRQGSDICIYFHRGVYDVGKGTKYSVRCHENVCYTSTAIRIMTLDY